MSASPVHYQNRTTRSVSVLAPFLRHVNTGTLAVVMLIALALLSSIHGKNATQSEIVIDNFSFSPKTFAVPAGGAVTWINHDNVPHVVTSTDDQFQKSPTLKTGQRFSDTFATAGTYSYFCSIQPRMTGKIAVK